MDFVDKLGAVSRALRALAARDYAELELGTTQAKFLRAIGQQGRISQAELARATVTDPALTGRALETLLERGWVTRKRSREDKRQYELELAASGKRKLERVIAARSRIAKRAVAALDERDLADFDRIADKLLGALAESKGQST